jgi:hypothetical protein
MKCKKPRPLTERQKAETIRMMERGGFNYRVMQLLSLLPGQRIPRQMA